MTGRKTTSTRSTRPRNTRLDSQAWLERAQSMQIYSSALRDADEKVLKLFDTVSEQTERYFEFNAKLYIATIVMIAGILFTSFIIAIFSSTGNLFYQIFSIVGLFSGTITLIILLFRNPLKHARQMLENTVRINVVFLSFVRRLQQFDLALRFVFMETQSRDFNKVHAQIQEFQNMVDQTSEEISQIIQDFGE
jgi:hypothetical protein